MTDTAYTVGCIKPVAATLYERQFEALLPPEVTSVVRTLDIEHGTIAEFRAALDGFEAQIERFAEDDVDLILARGTPPFMLVGFEEEGAIVGEWTTRYGVPVTTSTMIAANALRAVGADRFIGVGYDFEDVSIPAGYFEGAGFDVLGYGRPESVPWEEIEDMSESAIVELVESLHRDHPDAEAIYLQGGKWDTLDIVEPLEANFDVPVVQPIAARTWEIQRRLGLRTPREGYGRLLAELPPLEHPVHE